MTRPIQKHARSALALYSAVLLAAACPVGAAAQDGAAQDGAAGTRSAAVSAALHDYIDGQLEGDAARVARSLHPDVAKRAVSSSPREVFALRRMTADELVNLTARGELKTPPEQWDRSVTITYQDDAVALGRIETPWFTDHLQLARFGDEWLIVNAIWVPSARKGDAR